MKRLIIAGAIALAASLAACGGGGGSSPVPVTQPPVVATLAPQSYSARISWSSAMHPTGALASTMRRMMDAGTATPLPVMIAGQVCDFGQNCNNLPYGNEGYPLHAAALTMTISPSPTVTVVPTWAPVAGPAPIASPLASPSPGTLVVTATSKGGQDAASATAIVSGSPLTQTIPVEVYPSVALGCGSLYSGLTSAASFSGGVITTLSSPTGADAYVDGPYCTGAFQNSTEAGTTLHVPYGATLIADDAYAFIDVSVSQWASTFTSIALSQVPPPATPTQAIMLLKTGMGNYVKLFFTEGYGGDSAASPASHVASWEQSGSSIDGKF